MRGHVQRLCKGLKSVFAFFARRFRRPKIIRLSVELHPSHVNENGEVMYKVGYRTYIRYSDLAKAFDSAVEKGLFTTDVKWTHGDKD